MRGKIGEGKRKRLLARESRRIARLASQPQANVTVTFRHVEPTEALRLYAERKLAHVARLVQRVCDVHLTLSVDKYRQHGEVTVQAGPVAVAAQEETKDLYAVIDLLADKVGRQLKSRLGKIKTRRLRAPSTPQVLSAAEEMQPLSGVSRV